MNRLTIFLLLGSQFGVQEKDAAGDHGVERCPDLMAHICQN